jgi:hypothetical protein
MIGGRSRRRGARSTYWENALNYACLHLRDGELHSGVYCTAQPLATEVDEAVQGFLDGVTSINVPNDRTFCAAVRTQYAAAVAAPPAEVQS